MKLSCWEFGYTFDLLSKSMCVFELVEKHEG
jgi:hypothetical protein